jgi:diaminopimelate decarboxylase
MISERRAILEAYSKHAFLNAMHVHVGSGKMGVQMLVDGIRVVTELACQVGGQIRFMDIGGGLPANTYSDAWGDAEHNVPTMMEYAELLRKEIPVLFNGTFQAVVTEFGQALNAKAGVLVSRVEYVKQTDQGHTIAVVHFGADVGVRQCYTTDHQRRVEFYRLSASPYVPSSSIDCFKVSVSDSTPVSVAGPLCFQGDFTARNVPGPSNLTRLRDLVVLKDTGHNTLSLYSRHCSRQALAVCGYRLSPDRQQCTHWEVLKPLEDMEDVCRFWGSGQIAEWKKSW